MQDNNPNDYPYSQPLQPRQVEPKKPSALAAVCWTLLYALIFFIIQATVLLIFVAGTAFQQVFLAINTGELNPDDSAAVSVLVEDLVAGVLATTLPWAMLISGIITVILCWLIIRKRGFNAKAFASLNPVKPSVVIIALILGASFSLALNALFNIPGLEFLQDYETSLAQQLLFGSILTAIVGSTIVPVVEEILFRGFILNELRRSFTLLPSVLFSSLLFGILHGTAAWALMAATLGLLLTWIALRARSVYPAITAHMGINGASFALVWSGVNNPTAFYAMLVGGGALFLFCMFLLINKTQSLKDLEPAPEPLPEEPYTPWQNTDNNN